MSAHHCHAMGCKTPCPPRLLMCLRHWRLVAPATQREVYRTVRLRGRVVDATWAPWWRAAHRAIYEVARAEGHGGERLERWHARQRAFAAQLETLRSMAP